MTGLKNTAIRWIKIVHHISLIPFFYCSYIRKRRASRFAPVNPVYALIPCIIMLFIAGCTKNRISWEGTASIGSCKTGEIKPAPEKSSVILTGGGHNLWENRDGFFFAWNRVNGDLDLQCDIEWIGKGSHEHRKAGWMVRQDLSKDAAYADAVIHGDGLISLQYREKKGGPTLEVRSQIRAPVTLLLQRRGNVYSLSLSRKGEPFQPAGVARVDLSDPVYAGLLVCSHDSTTSESAMFSNVRFENPGPVPDTARVLESTLEVMELETRSRRIVLREKNHFEAPNWSRDGSLLYYNSKGRIYTIPVPGGTLRMLDTGVLDACNNDHGLSPDGAWLAVSNQTDAGSKIYVLPGSGGQPRLVTEKAPSYWHGWSPDGKTLAYCAERGGEFDVYDIPAEGGQERRLTRESGLDDGPDYSPDWKFIFLNSERTGRMHIWRIGSDGSNPVQMTSDEAFCDWFPHPSPDGKWIVFLSYDGSVKGHPPEQIVRLRLMPAGGGPAETLAVLYGGQGTINVPSWSPDSRYFAFVSYSRVQRDSHAEK